MLLQIAAKKKQRVIAAKCRLPLEQLKESLTAAGSPGKFRAALTAPGISVIAEIKRASPSKGDFGLRVPITELAGQYEAGGASAISVLTEEDFFLGSQEDLTAVRQTVTLPVLRKDFVIDAYQLYETRALNADAVLLIAGFLPEKQLAGYLEICEELGLAALVETHNQEEIKLALRAGANILGINNRDLRTFRTDINRTVRLAGLIPDDVVLVSESGIHTAEDIKMLTLAGADAVLVGESLVKSADAAAKIREFSGRATGNDTSKNMRG
ncbi:MAG: indole-3-glycerol phosphate synthase TrpC [Bacillota bacterium]|nr:indole-3-glycerol phosphate synthase TrpC [Bacillota bacterium]MDW7684587.1 indole-3-glycerol phosphate synthase TrpC [Bacillota bacterium]